MRKLPGAKEKDTLPSTPRWVKVFGIIALVLILLFVILHLAGGGFGHHMSNGPVDHTTPIELGLQ